MLELNEFIHDDNYTTPELQGAVASARGASKRGSDVNTSHKLITVFSFAYNCKIFNCKFWI